MNRILEVNTSLELKRKHVTHDRHVCRAHYSVRRFIIRTQLEESSPLQSSTLRYAVYIII